MKVLAVMRRSPGKNPRAYTTRAEGGLGGGCQGPTPRTSSISRITEDGLARGKK